MNSEINGVIRRIRKGVEARDEVKESDFEDYPYEFEFGVGVVRLCL